LQQSAGPGERGDAAGQIRVAVADDSAVIRGMVSRWLELDPDIKVVATYANGAIAVRQIADTQPDVLILDIEMPEMDGMTALPLLLKAVPELKVIMSSTLTRRNAEVSLRALSIGAVDYIAKPESRYGSNDDFRNELVQKVKVHATLRRRRLAPQSARSAPAAPPSAARPTGAAPASAAPASAALAGRASPPTAPGNAPAGAGSFISTGSLWGKQQVVLRAASRSKPTILAVGASTGGPQALFKFLGALSPDLTVPVMLTQHMPATFTAILAEHIQNATKRPCKEAATGDVLQAGHIYVAPGDYHMTVVAEGAQRVIKINQDPPENFCRPAVDPMFRSVAKVFGAQALTVILTGMGSDGREGARVICDAGGTLICQDEPSSVVWGMPGAAATAGLASQVLPLDQIAPAVARILKGGL
jgi:two-component system chemotaxis response regulator CheB